MEDELPIIKLSTSEIKFLIQYRYFYRLDGTCTTYSYDFGSAYYVIEPVVKSLIKKNLLVGDSGFHGVGLTKLGNDYAWILHLHKTL